MRSSQQIAAGIFCSVVINKLDGFVKGPSAVLCCLVRRTWLRADTHRQAGHFSGYACVAPGAFYCAVPIFDFLQVYQAWPSADSVSKDSESCSRLSPCRTGLVESGRSAALRYSTVMEAFSRTTSYLYPLPKSLSFMRIPVATTLSPTLALWCEVTVRSLVPRPPVPSCT